MRGKNMFAVGLLCALFNKDLDTLKEVISGVFKKKTREVIDTAIKLAIAGCDYLSDRRWYRFGRDVESIQ